MPTYVYKRADGSTFEIQQKMTDPALETCPTTGQPVKRQIGAGAGLIFKGDGFYITDYARKGRPDEKPSPAKADEESTENASAEKTDTPASGEKKASNTAESAD